MALTAMRIRIISVFVLLTLRAASNMPAAADFNQLMHQGQDALSKADLSGAEVIYRQACSDNPGSLAPQELASCEHHLAVIDEARGNVTSAEQRLLRALSEWEQAGERFRPSYAMSVMNLGEIYRKQRRFPEAQRELQRAVELAHELGADYTQVYGQALSRLGGLYVQADNPARGRPLLLSAIGIFYRLAPGQDAENARALDTLGIAEILSGRYAEAESRLTEAIAVSSSASGERSPETVACESDLALAFIQDRKYDRAEPLLKRARFGAESQPKPDDSRLAAVFAEMSIMACGQNKFALAEEYARQSLAALNRSPGRNASLEVQATVNLAVVYLREHRLADAERILPDAVATERRIAPDTCLLADGLRELGELRALQHSWHEASVLFKESIAIYENKLGPDNRSIAPLLSAYAEVLKREGASRAEVRTVQSRAKAILSLVPPG